MKNRNNIKIIFILLCCITFSVAQQQNRVKQSVFVELLGNGLLYSINYERYINQNMSIRLGGMAFHWVFVWGEQASMVLFPVMWNYLVGDTNYKFEFGFGAFMRISYLYKEKLQNIKILFLLQGLDMHIFRKKMD